jgi:VCBS repeat-containing protein
MNRSRNHRRTAREMTSKAVLEALENRQLLSTTFYVAANGNDNNAGTQASPWATLQHAANEVQAGDTVDVGAGDYAGFQLSTSGKAGAPITFDAASGAVINGTPGSLNGEIDLSYQSYVTIEGFTIDPTNQTAARAGIWAGGQAGANVTNLILQDNTITHTDWWGILLGFTNNSLITKNNISDVEAQHGIYCGNSPVDDTISFNVISDTNGCGIEDNADGTQGGSGISTGMVLDGNIISDAANGTGAGINFDGVQDSLIENNVIYGSQRNGIALYQYNGNGPSSGDTIVNNTIDMNSNGPSGYAAIQVIDGAINTTIYNNILSSAEMSLEIDPASMSGLKSDYNVFGASGIDPTGVSYSNNITLAAWQAKGYDTHSVQATSVSALFVDAATGNFNLASGSQAIGAGTSTDAPTSDFNGDSRPTDNRYDVGAMQYQGTAAPTSPTPPTTPTVTAPTANNDSYSTTAGTTLNVNATDGVLANDTDPNGLSLSATLVKGPAHGTLTLNSDGSFSYVASSSFSGTDTFTYTAEDSDATSSAATVTITVKAAATVTPPTNPTPAPTADDLSYADQQGKTLNVSAAQGLIGDQPNSAGGTMTCTLVSGPADGALTLNANGSFTYSPTAAFSGKDTFTYALTDSSGTSSPATVTINVTPTQDSSTPTPTSSTPSTTPAAPTALRAWSGNQAVVLLNWQDNTGDASQIEIQRSTDGTNFTTIATVSASQHNYVDNTVSSGTPYYYRLVAVSAAGDDSDPSLVVTVTPGTDSWAGIHAGGGWHYAYPKAPTGTSSKPTKTGSGNGGSDSDSNSGSGASALRTFLSRKAGSFQPWSDVKS